MNIKINLQTILATIGLVSLLYLAYKFGEERTSHVYDQRIESMNMTIDSLISVNRQLDIMIDSLDKMLSEMQIDTVITLPPLLDSSIVNISSKLKSHGINNSVLDSSSVKVDKENCINILHKCDSLEQLLRMKIKMSKEIELLHEKVLYEERKIENLEKQVELTDSVNIELNRRISLLSKKMKYQRIKYSAIIAILGGYIFYENVIKK